MGLGRIGVIGAGMAGLACARRLADAGYSPVVLDKGRGIGGRLATRRTEDGLQFDHGAQYVTGRSEGFCALLDAMENAGAAARWSIGDGERVVGTPGMSALAKHIGAGLAIQQNAEATRVRETAEGWEVSVDGASVCFDLLVLTAPAPQVATLLGPQHRLAREIADVRLTPCLTLMAAFPLDQPEPFVTRRDPDDPIAWIALDSSKPGRDDQVCWVAQAGKDWSEQHLEWDPHGIAREMLAMLCDRLGTTSSSARHAVAHRWRYAAVAEPLGKPFARNESATLYLGGDWCLEARVEAAWTSGTAIADDILANA